MSPRLCQNVMDGSWIARLGGHQWNKGIAIVLEKHW